MNTLVNTQGLNTRTLNTRTRIPLFTFTSNVSNNKRELLSLVSVVISYK